MSSRHVFVLCEGMQDIALIGRILVLNGVEPVNKRICDYPVPLNGFFEKRFSKRILGDGFKFKRPFAQDSAPTLAAVFENKEKTKTWYFLDCCGDSRYEEIRAFVDAIRSVLNPGVPGTYIKDSEFLLINDADDGGLASRLKNINDKLGHSFKLLNPAFTEFKHGEKFSSGSVSIGCWVWHRAEDSKGTLEDLYHKHAQCNLPLYGEAVAYVDKHKGELSRVAKGTLAKKFKAALTITGQVNNPGDSLAVILRDNDGLNAFVANCEVCAGIKDFIM